MFFEAGDTANGQECSRIIIKADNKEDALKYLLEHANMYIRSVEENEIITNEDEYVDLTG